jgi:hypothetical protein
MRTTLMVLGLVLVLLAFATSDANAVGPFCFTTAPFADTFVWFLNNNGANQFIGTGRDLSGDRAQSVTGFVTGNSLIVGYATYSKGGGFVPVTGGGTLSLSTGNGPGNCFAPDLASCGAFTFTLIACPAGALSDEAGDAATGPVQGATQ